jgi:hypothetical protein
MGKGGPEKVTIEQAGKIENESETLVISFGSSSANRE